MGTRIHRVIVRGAFDGLDERQQSALRRAQHRHDVLDSQFTEDGTLTYGLDLGWFNLRYEVRTDDDQDADPAAIAEQAALARATAQLSELGIPYKHLRAVGSDMTAIWS